MKRAILIFLLVAMTGNTLTSFAQTVSTRTLSGTVITRKNESVKGVTVVAVSSKDRRTAVTDSDGRFALEVPREPITVRVEGKYIVSSERSISLEDRAEDIEVEVDFVIPRVHESMVIVAPPLEPAIDRRNEEVFKNTLFSRDDQVFHTLDAGINAGQHEGGGKSLEIRRFGFNLDHGGVNGGLKVLVDN
ncbi:MAG TPA: carboxypeptidase-like regulatory domain-containing protein, partial [Blastocatellia bacterium]|nr:carboxypeptidase-like regulatory domain-containing protein [Blastocatellia bacterium]